MFTLLTPQLKRLPLYLAGIGTQEPESHLHRPAGQEMHQIALVTRGNGKIIHKNNQQLLTEGDCFCLSKNQPHDYFPTEPPMHTLWILFDGDAADDMMNLLTDNTGYCTISPAAPGALLSKARAILQLAERNSQSEQLSAMLYDFLIEVLQQKEMTGTRSDLEKRLEPAVGYMEKHLKRALTLEEIASVLSLSKFQFCKLFREVYQITPFTYLTQLRLQNAKELLSRNPSISVKEAALSSGFRDVSYFGTVFRRYEKMTPKEFQIQYRKK